MNLIKYMPIFFFVFNRSASKIKIGPVYLMDPFLMFLFFRRLKKTLFYTRKCWAIYIFLLISSLWLLDNYIDYGFENNEIRRFALAIYTFIPLLFIANKDIFSKIFSSPLLALLVILLVAIIRPDNFQMSLAAESSVLLFYISISNYEYKKNKFFLYSIFLSVFNILLMSSGALSDGSLYKTPLLGFFIICFILLYRKLRFIRKGVSIKFFIVSICTFIVAILMYFFTPIISILMSELLNGLSGLTGNDYLSEIANEIYYSSDRARGSSVGTATTRLFFWSGIVNYNLADQLRFLIGNGHHEPFFKLIFPNRDFLDAHLISPHNSFVSIFYQYGMVGLSIFIFYLYQVIGLIKSQCSNSKHVFPCLLIAINYASFEVALEAPHGALLFWLMICTPLFLSNTLKMNT